MAQKPKRPMLLEEKLGHVWAAIFVFSVTVLAIVLFAKGCGGEG